MNEEEGRRAFEEAKKESRLVTVYGDYSPMGSLHTYKVQIILQGKTVRWKSPPDAQIVGEAWLGRLLTQWQSEGHDYWLHATTMDGVAYILMNEEAPSALTDEAAFECGDADE
jgi:hypothetical protein